MSTTPAAAPTAQPTNTLTKMAKFFGASLSEFQTFWKSLSDAEKQEFKDAVQKWDGQTEFVK